MYRPGSTCRVTLGRSVRRPVQRTAGISTGRPFSSTTSVLARGPRASSGNGTGSISQRSARSGPSGTAVSESTAGCDSRGLRNVTRTVAMTPRTSTSSTVYPVIAPGVASRRGSFTAASVAPATGTR